MLVTIDILRVIGFITIAIVNLTFYIKNPHPKCLINQGDIHMDKVFVAIICVALPRLVFNVAINFGLTNPESLLEASCYVCTIIVLFIDCITHLLLLIAYLPHQSCQGTVYGYVIMANLAHFFIYQPLLATFISYTYCAYANIIF